MERRSPNEPAESQEEIRVGALLSLKQTKTPASWADPTDLMVTISIIKPCTGVWVEGKDHGCPTSVTE